MLYYSSLRSMSAVLIEGGAYTLSFRPHGRSIWQLNCPRPAGIGHPWQKKRKEDKERNAYALGLAGGGGGMGAAKIA